jgi:hypothetical protein
VRILVLIALLATTAAAEPSVGSVRGRVVDRATAEPAIGATIAVVGATPGDEHAAITDELGNFVVDALPPGRYTVVVYYLDVTEQRMNVDVGAGDMVVVNLRIDTSAADSSQLIEITEPHRCCGGCPCSGPCGRRFEGALGAEMGSDGPTGEEVAAPRSAADPRLGLSARGAAGVRDTGSGGAATTSFDLEATYAVTRRIDLALAGGVALGDGSRWHGAAGVRVFASKHLFVQPQLTLPLGMSLIEGVSFDLHRAVAIYAFAAQAFDRDAGSVLGGAGVEARY